MKKDTNSKTSRKAKLIAKVRSAVSRRGLRKLAESRTDLIAKVRYATRVLKAILQLMLAGMAILAAVHVI